MEVVTESLCIPQGYDVFRSMRQGQTPFKYHDEEQRMGRKNPTLLAQEMN